MNIIKEFLVLHPKITRAWHTFWQASLASFIGALSVLLPIAINVDGQIDLIVLESGIFGAFIGALSAGLSAIKSIIAGVPEEI